MNRNRLLASVVITVFALTVPGWAQSSQSREVPQQDQLARRSRITKAKAQEIALKRAHGNVESSELEKEHGRLVYSFDIRNSHGDITEVQVSAITGRIVRVEHESKKREELEKKKEAKP
jgi:uncharacterized membrane protein YkoI